MKSIFLLSSVLCAVSYASECQADEHSLLQARRLVRTAKTMGSKDSIDIDMLKNMRVVAESLLDGSDTTMSPDEVNEALDAANELLAELSPVIRQQIDNAQQQIDDAASAVQVCHAQSVAEMRSSLQESTGQHAAAVESCHNTLDQLQTAETQQCNVAEDCLCDEARVRTTDQEPLCAAITETYEVAFCEHHHVCTIFHQCHSQEAQVFQHLRADVEAEMAFIVQEYIAVEQSRCLTGLIMEAMTPPRTPISHAALIACDDVDVSALNINFPDLPSEPAACPAHTHGDPQCEGSWDWSFATHHAGKYLAGHAAGDSTIRTVSAAAERCDELGVACGGITCRSEASCTVRAGTNLLNSPSGEFSFMKAYSIAPVAGTYSESHVGQYLSGHAAGDSTIRPISEAQDACNQLGDQCAGITCRSETSCTVRAGHDLRTSPSGEFSFKKMSPGPVVLPEPVVATSHTSFRLTVTSTYASTTHFQISELHLYNQDSEVDLSGTVTSPTGTVEGSHAIDCRSSEGPEFATDSNSGTKWCVHALTVADGVINPNVVLSIQLPQATTVTGLSFTTGNDVNTRDPRRFRLEGSNGNNQWDMIVDHSCSDATRVTARRTRTPVFTTASAGC